jgi:hypothetical protein
MQKNYLYTFMASTVTTSRLGRFSSWFRFGVRVVELLACVKIIYLIRGIDVHPKIWHLKRSNFLFKSLRKSQKLIFGGFFLKILDPYTHKNH